MQTTAVKALNDFFNSGNAKKPIREFNDELKALSPAEKLELGTLAAAAMGNTIKPTAP